ncbi:MAG: response regulator transcription factor, partial [Sedimenticolaceae bacterium]
MSSQIGVLLVDDHALLRKGLAVLLNAEADIRVVGEAGDGKEAIARVYALKPDVVIMDISMPGLSGIDATRQIRADSPDSKVIALSIHSSKRFVDDMLDAGAAGYLLKESAPEELVQAIHAVMRGEMYLSSAITTTVVSAYVEGMAEQGATKDSGAAAGILRTKLHRPPPPQDLVPRTRLLERLETGRVRPLT